MADPRYVNLTAPAGGYEAQLADIKRRQKYAELLAQQGGEDIKVEDVGGIPTPISPFQGLAKALQSGMGGYLAGKAAEEEAALERGEKAAIASGFADILKRGDIPASQGAQLPDDASGIEQYAVNPAQKGKGKYVLTSDEQQEALIKLVTERPGASAAASSYSKLIESARERDKPKFEGIGARGTMDTNPDSPTYRQVIGAPIERPIDLPSSVDEYNFAKTLAGGNFKGSYTDWLKTRTGATTRITVDGGRRDFSLKTNLRKEFNLLPDVKAFNDVASSYDVISDIANRKQPSPQDDLSLIYSYVKMLDPNSVVREGEFATAENSASVPDRIRNAYNKVIEGTRLNSDQRRQYSNAAKGIYESRSRRYNDLVSEYSDYARDAGLDPQEVFRARGKAGPAPATEPSSPASGGWTTLPSGVRIRERK
jgi:hypothetical protein